MATMARRAPKTRGTPGASSGTANHGATASPSLSAGSSCPPASFQARVTNLRQARYLAAALAGAERCFPVPGTVRLAHGWREHRALRHPWHPDPAAGPGLPTAKPAAPTPLPPGRGGAGTVGHMAIAPRVDNVAQRLF